MQQTSSRLDKLLDLLSGIHGAQVKRLDDWAGVEQFGSVIGRRGKLLDVLASHARRRLLESNNRTITSVTLDEKDSLLIANEDVIAADVVQPGLHSSLDSDLILIGADTCRGDWGRNGGDKSVGVGRNEMVGVFLNLGMGSSHGPELGSAEPGEVGL